jgi:RNA recognition motif-containing protein
MYTICINNISANTSEFDLEATFQTYGRVRRVHVPTTNKNHSKSKANRGFAFVSFTRKSDAEEALVCLQRFRFDYMVWNLEWAKPRQRNNEESPGNTPPSQQQYTKKISEEIRKANDGNDNKHQARQPASSNNQQQAIRKFSSSTTASTVSTTTTSVTSNSLS